MMDMTPEDVKRRLKVEWRRGFTWGSFYASGLMALGILVGRLWL